MKNFWKKYKEYVFLISLPIVAVVLVIFAVKPLIARLDEKSDKIQEIMLDHDYNQKRLSDLPKLRSQALLVERNEGKLDVFFTESNIVSLVEKIEAIAGETGNQISIEVQEKDDEKKKKKKDEEEAGIKLPGDDYFEMTLNVTGNYANLISFINKIENLNYFSDIIALDISKIEAYSPSSASVASNPFSITESIPAAEDNDEDQGESEPENVIYSSIDIVYYLGK